MDESKVKGSIVNGQRVNESPLIGVTRWDNDDFDKIDKTCVQMFFIISPCSGLHYFLDLQVMFAKQTCKTFEIIFEVLCASGTAKLSGVNPSLILK